MRSARTNYERYAKLARKGYIAPAQLAQYANARDTELVKRAALATNLQNARKTLEQAKGEQAAMAAQGRVAEADARNSLATLAQETAEHDGRRATGVLAPAAGRVSTFAYDVGHSVAAGTVLANVVPAGEVLEAQLLVPSHARASIRLGQRVELRLDAFPYQKYGLVAGTVEQVDLTPASELPPGTAPGAVLYRARVTLSAQALTMYGQRTAFSPGMTLQADIFNDRRRLIEWVIDPLVSAAKGRAP